MRKLALFACLGVLLVGSPVWASTITLTFDAPPIDQDAHGLTNNGVTFGFPAELAVFYNFSDGPGSGNVVNLDDHVLAGDGLGMLTMNFSAPIYSLSFFEALDTTDSTNNSPSNYVDLFNASTLVFSGIIDTNPLKPFPATHAYSEGAFNYSGGPVTRAEVHFDTTTGGCDSNPGRCAGGVFAIDTLSYDNAPGSNPVPEPASLTLMGLGAAGLRLLRRRQS